MRMTGVSLRYPLVLVDEQESPVPSIDQRASFPIEVSVTHDPSNIATRTIFAAKEQPLPDHEIHVQIIRSKRRKKTVSGRLLNWYTLEVRAPADISEQALQKAIDSLVTKARVSLSKSRSFRSDARLEERTKSLNTRYFKGQLQWRSIRFVSNQHKRFGSCSPALGTIRITDRLRTVPDFVLDYVIIHELAHLLHANHSPAFWKVVYRFAKTERARGYLIAMQLEDDQVEPDNASDE